MTVAATLPSSSRAIPRRPCVPMTIKSALSRTAVSTIASAGGPRTASGRTSNPFVNSPDQVPQPFLCNRPHGRQRFVIVARMPETDAAAGASRT